MTDGSLTISMVTWDLELSEQLFFYIEKALIWYQMAPNSQLEPCIDLIQGEIVNAQELIKQPNLTWVSSTTNNQYIKELLRSWIEWDKIEKIQEMIEWENIISFEWDYRSYAEGLEENNEMRI